MTSTLVNLILFARYPVAGQAKTRLIPAIGADGAAKVHKLLAEKTAATLFEASGNDANFILSYTGGEEDDFRKWLGDDKNYEPQLLGDLTDRLLAMLDPPVIFFGSDTPDLTVEHARDAIWALTDHDIVIGPALDGGYYLIGMKQRREDLLRDMPWSSDKVLPITLERCKAAGLKVKMLEALSDCDMPEDLDRWPWLKAQYPAVTL